MVVVFFCFLGVKCFYAHTSEKRDKPSSSPLIPNVELCNPQETLYQTLRQVTQKANVKEFFREKQVLRMRGFLDLSVFSFFFNNKKKVRAERSTCEIFKIRTNTIVPDRSTNDSR
jgi:hypothetical protein